MFLEDIVLRGYIRLLPLLLLISCGTKQVEYPDNVFFYSQFPQEKELKGEIIELDSIFFRYPFRVRVEGDKVIVMDLRICFNILVFDIYLLLEGVAIHLQKCCQ